MKSHYRGLSSRKLPFHGLWLASVICSQPQGNAYIRNTSENTYHLLAFWTWDEGTMYDLAQIICSGEIRELLSASRIPAGTWGKERLIQPLLRHNWRFRCTRMRFNRRFRTFYLPSKTVLLSLFLCEIKPICYMIYQAKRMNASLPN